MPDIRPVAEMGRLQSSHCGQATHGSCCWGHLLQGMDAYDFAEPVDILPRLDKGFWEGLAAAKWTERRDALRSLRQLAAAPRLAPGDYADVVRELRKV